MKRLLIVFVMGALWIRTFASIVHAEPVAQPAPQQKAPQETAPLTLRVVGAGLSENGVALQIACEITNISGKELVFLPPLDGSEIGRFPRISIDLLDENGRAAAVSRQLLWCGTVNPLMPGDFVKLAPDEKWTFTVLHSPPAESGEYSLIVAYDTSEREPEKWLGSKTSEQDAVREQLLQLIKQVPAAVIRNEPIRTSLSGVR